MDPYHRKDLIGRTLRILRRILVLILLLLEILKRLNSL